MPKSDSELFTAYCKDNGVEHRIPYSDLVWVDYEENISANYSCLDGLLSNVYLKKGHHESSRHEKLLEPSEYPQGEYEKKFFRWYHRHPHHIEYDLTHDNIEIWDAFFRNSVAEYLKNRKLHSAWFDWYCAEILIYNELVSASQSFRYSHEGSLGAHMKMWMWQVCLGILIILMVSSGDPLRYALSLLIFSFAAYIYIKYSSDRKRIKALLDSMANTYSLLETGEFSWKTLWKNLDESRKLGAVWPDELWQLVEVRMGVRSPHDF